MSVVRAAFWVFLGLYVVALLLFAIGTFGWFGSERGPLAGVFLVPLGLPWNQLLDSVAEGARPWLAAGAPLLNLGLLWWLGRFLASRAAGAG